MKVFNTFKDAPFAPEMVVVPAGEFMMGSPENERGRYGAEGPQHRVIISRPFAIGKFAVTFDEYDAAYAEGGCSYYPPDEGWGRGDRPVIGVAWDDAKVYLNWLSKKTGEQYRLPSEAEWEYAARAGTTTPFWWGSTISTDQANYDGGEAGGFLEKTVPVKTFQPNPWGLYQVHGNVWEWCEDCRGGDYRSATTDGSAWAGPNRGRCIIRGGSWVNLPRDLRSAARVRNWAGNRSEYIGLRLARTL